MYFHSHKDCINLSCTKLKSNYNIHIASNELCKPNKFHNLNLDYRI